MSLKFVALRPGNTIVTGVSIELLDNTPGNPLPIGNANQVSFTVNCEYKFMSFQCRRLLPVMFPLK